MSEERVRRNASRLNHVKIYVSPIYLRNVVCVFFSVPNVGLNNIMSQLSRLDSRDGAQRVYPPSIPRVLLDTRSLSNGLIKAVERVTSCGLFSPCFLLPCFQLPWRL